MNGPENCTNCKFSAEAEGQGLLCRRNPPTPVSVTATPFISGEGREFKMDVSQVFPSVSDVTWCGEYSQTDEFARELLRRYREEQDKIVREFLEAELKRAPYDFNTFHDEPPTWRFRDFFNRLKRKFGNG